MQKLNIHELVDRQARRFLDRQDLEGLETHLINNPDFNYIRADQKANAAWCKAVKLYISELHRIRVWNLLSQ